MGHMRLFEIPKNDPERREYLKAELALRGYTLRSIAREIGCASVQPSKALRHQYPRLEREIARRLDMRPEDIWPERYSNGYPLCRSYRARRSCRAGGAR